MKTIPCEECVLRAICIGKNIVTLFMDCTPIYHYVKYDIDDRCEMGRRVDRINEVMKRAFRFETDVITLIPKDDLEENPTNEYYIIFDDENGTDFVIHQRFNIN